LEKLRHQVNIARDLANGIKVGVTFHPNTTLELKPPENLSQLSTNSRVSAFVKTDKPNGFLMYLGNENKTDGRRGKRDDFMALEVENGYPVLTIDLGNGPERIISNKHISNGKWHQVVVDRMGNNVKLIVQEEDGQGQEVDHTVDMPLPGDFSVFNLNQESRLFVGGYPPDFNMQKEVRYPSFEGQIEELKIGDSDVGLWNFLDGQNNRDGARERDQLVPKEKPPTGFRFGGSGYVILDSRPYSFKQRSNIEFKFKAPRDTHDGLMFYAGKHRHFISVEMRNGAVLFQFKLGQHAHVVQIGINDTFNDDKWHKVEAGRDGKKGVLKIDERTIYQEESMTPNNDEEEFLKISDQMYFGGFPGKINHTEVMNKNFDGCIDEVSISGTLVDLSNNLKAYDVRPGCPSKFSPLISYPADKFGYIKRPNLTVSNSIQVNLKFKTIYPKGILFYGTNFDQSQTFGLAMTDGILVLRSSGAELNTGSNKYNNGEWHVATATHDGNYLRLSIDDTDHFRLDDPVAGLSIQYGDLYFGGLPPEFQATRHALSTTAYFTGCLSDVTVSGHIVNFANLTEYSGGVIGSCSRDLYGKLSR
jgi:laminin, alpha 3/5